MDKKIHSTIGPQSVHYREHIGHGFEMILAWAFAWQKPRVRKLALRTDHVTGTI